MTNTDPPKLVYTLPDELRLVPAAVVRRDWSLPETTLWRADKDGRLPRLRIGKRAFYRFSDLKDFLAHPDRRQPISVAWTPAETSNRKKRRPAIGEMPQAAASV